jgi:hypothetical protein
MTTLRVTSVSFVFVCLSRLAQAAEPTVTFSGLSKGDELSLTFTSSGCFHHNVYDFKFRRTDSLSVEIDFYPRDPADDRPGPGKKKRIGELILSEADIAGLDRMLEYYRAKPEGACTSVNEISLSRLSDGKTTTEKLHDSSCSDAGAKAEFSLLGLIGTIRMKQELPNVKLK